MKKYFFIISVLICVLAFFYCIFLYSPKLSIPYSHLRYPKRLALVIDLKDNGIETVSTDGDLFFDYQANGLYENTGWIGKDDAFLVRDSNHDGLITNGRNIFGNNMLDFNGCEAANGFEALKNIDSNHDDILDAKDAFWRELKTWRDYNTNGRVDFGELQPLEVYGIKKIYLQPFLIERYDANNNFHLAQGIVEKNDGKRITIQEILFDSDISKIRYSQIKIPKHIQNLPQIAANGYIRSLHEAMAKNSKLSILVKNFIKENNSSKRDLMLDKLIFHWAGIYSDYSKRCKQNIVQLDDIDDINKLKVIELYLGKIFSGTDNNGNKTSTPNPNAILYILQAYDILKKETRNLLLEQSHYKDYIKLIHNNNASNDVEIKKLIELIEEQNKGNSMETLAILHDLLEITVHHPQNNRLKEQIKKFEKDINKKMAKTEI